MPSNEEGQLTMLSWTTNPDHRRPWHRIVVIIIIIVLLAIFSAVLAFSARIASMSPVTAVTVTFVSAGVAAAAFAVKVFFPLLLQLFGGAAAASQE